MAKITDAGVRSGASAASSQVHIGLQRNQLSLFEVLALAIAVIAPTAMPTLAAPGVYGSSGNGTWLAYAVATLALVFVALNINAFARHEASPGALYVVAAKGCGPIWGVIAGWSLLIGYVFTAAALISGASGYLLTILRDIGIGGPDIVLGVALSAALIAGAWAFGYRSVKLSSRASLAIEAVTVMIILALVIGFMVLHRTGTDHAQLTLEDVSADQVRQGLVLAFFSFVGFEAATAVGAEASNPFRTIPRAVLLSVVICGVFFIFVAYGLVLAFHTISHDLGQSSAPLTEIAAGLGLTGVGDLIALGVAMSGFACTLGSINAGSRVLYALSHHGLFSQTARRTHAEHATPHVALGVVAIAAFAFSLALTICGVHGPDAFAYLGTLASFGFIFVYALVSIATPLYLRQRGLLRPVHVATSAAALILLAIALYGSIYPVPAWPLNVIPYAFLFLVLIGVAYFLALRAFAPGRLSAIEADLVQTQI